MMQADDLMRNPPRSAQEHQERVEMYEFEKTALEGFLMHQINGCVNGECGDYAGPHLQCDESGCYECNGDSPDLSAPQEVEMQRRGMRPASRSDGPSAYDVAMQRTFGRDNRDVWTQDDYNVQPEDPRMAMMAQQEDPRMAMMQMDPRMAMMAEQEDPRMAMMA